MAGQIHGKLQNGLAAAFLGQELVTPGSDVGSCVMGSPEGWHSETGLGVPPQALAFLWLHLE